MNKEMNIEEKRKVVNELSIFFNSIDYLRRRAEEAGQHRKRYCETMDYEKCPIYKRKVEVRE